MLDVPQARCPSPRRGRHQIATGVSPWSLARQARPAPAGGDIDDVTQRLQSMPPPAGARWPSGAPVLHGLTAVAIGCRPLRGLGRTLLGHRVTTPSGKNWRKLNLPSRLTSTPLLLLQRRPRHQLEVVLHGLIVVSPHARGTRICLDLGYELVLHLLLGSQGHGRLH